MCLTCEEIASYRKGLVSKREGNRQIAQPGKWRWMKNRDSTANQELKQKKGTQIKN